MSNIFWNPVTPAITGIAIMIWAGAAGMNYYVFGLCCFCAGWSVGLAVAATARTRG